MKKITPYTSTYEAMQDLDNGGRFYNFFTKANDGKIAASEVEKASGIFAGDQKIALFLELATSKLDEESKKRLKDKMDKKLHKILDNHQVQNYAISEAIEHGTVKSIAKITGIPTPTDSQSDFSGFLMMPLQVGDVTTFMMVPLADEYDVYELKDEATDKALIIAHPKNKEKLPEKKITVAGVFQEFSADQKGNKPSKKFLNVNYYKE